MRLRDVGWVWEGQGLDPGVHPSLYGVGEGAPYFGLTRAWYMFHPNDDLAMRKLRHLDEVVCDIAKWKFHDVGRTGSETYVDAKLETVLAEAENVSRLSTRYPNVTGAVHDDMKGLVQREGITPEQYAQVYAALQQHNPALKLWSVVYTHELDPGEWDGFQPFMDVVSLWVWHATDLPKLDDDLERCREMFPGKPVVLGCYIRDYPTVAAVPMHLLKLQWEKLLGYLEAGKVAGYSILGAVLIDGHQEQVNWIRDFIAAN